MKIRDRLENMLIEKGYAVELLWGVTGQWRKSIMDVMRWEAQGKDANGHYFHIGSWSTMTECVRRGFSVTREERDPPYELTATAERRRNKNGVCNAKISDPTESKARGAGKRP